jgi:hypothetical protein
LNDKQIEALNRLRDARKPLKIHASTRRVLKEAGYAAEGANGYCTITEEGITFLANRERRERMVETETKIWRDKELAELHRHCQAWIDVHARLTIPAKHYSDFVLAALLTGSPVLPSAVEGQKKEEWDERVRAWAEVALDSVRELRARQADARENPTADLLVSYSLGPKLEKRAAERRSAAAERAAEEAEDNVVRMDRYLAERSG